MTAPEIISPSIKILLVDDHSLFRDGLRHLLAGLDRQVEIIEAANVEEALEQLKNNENDPPDLILSDLLMPDKIKTNGISKLVNTAQNIPVTIISMVEDINEIRKALSFGAIGFIPKSCTPDVMLKAIDLIISGGTFVPQSVLTASAEPRKPRGGSQRQRLTPRQQAVFEQLAMGKTNRDIAQTLNLSEATVKVHVAAIMRTLNVSNRTQVALTGAKALRKDGES